MRWVALLVLGCLSIQLAAPVLAGEVLLTNGQKLDQVQIVRVGGGGVLILDESVSTAHARLDYEREKLAGVQYEWLDFEGHLLLDWSSVSGAKPDSTTRHSEADIVRALDGIASETRGVKTAVWGTFLLAIGVGIAAAIASSGGD